MKNNMLKILGLATVIFCTPVFAQSKKAPSKKAPVKEVVVDSVALKKKAAAEENAKLPKPYDETENAEAKINELIAQAQKENKNIILQGGGNWCIWCLRFNNFVQTTPEIKKIVDENYLYYHLNYSPKNKNEAVYAKYGNPGDKYGYPVFIVLDKNGQLIHVQESGILEEGKGYSIEKVAQFFNDWTPKKQ